MCMYRISPTSLIREYHTFSKDFWLSYKTLEKMLPEIQFADMKMKLLKSKKIILNLIPGLDIDQFKIEREILEKEWTQKNEEAKQTGTLIHEQIHNLFCTDLHYVKTNFGIDTDKYQVQRTEEFLKANKGIFNEFKLEIPIAEDFLLVGIADCIIRDGNHISIIDFKSDEKISFRSIYEVGKKKSKRMKYPLVNLEDAAGVHYQIQLSLYAWMVQQLDPNLVIDKLIIVQVENLKKKKEFVVEYLKDDIEKLLKWHVKATKLKIEMNKCNTMNYD